MSNGQGDNFDDSGGMRGDIDKRVWRIILCGYVYSITAALF